MDTENRFADEFKSNLMLLIQNLHATGLPLSRLKYEYKRYFDEELCTDQMFVKLGINLKERTDEYSDWFKIFSSDLLKDYFECKNNIIPDKDEGIIVVTCKRVRSIYEMKALAQVASLSNIELVKNANKSQSLRQENLQVCSKCKEVIFFEPENADNIFNQKIGKTSDEAINRKIINHSNKSSQTTNINEDKVQGELQANSSVKKSTGSSQIMLRTGNSKTKVKLASRTLMNHLGEIRVIEYPAIIQKCGICRKSFPDEGAFNSHKIKCPFQKLECSCGKNFTTKLQLRGHLNFCSQEIQLNVPPAKKFRKILPSSPPQVTLSLAPGSPENDAEENVLIVKHEIDVSD